MKSTKSTQNFCIGESLYWNHKERVLVVRDYHMMRGHRNESDRRTKVIDVIVWHLFDEEGNEYRWRDGDIVRRMAKGEFKEVTA